MLTLLRRVAAVVALSCLGAGYTLPSLAQMPTTPQRSIEDPGAITTRQAITPAGAQTVFDGFVHRVGFSPSGELWVMTGTALYRLDWRDNQVRLDHKLAGERGVRGLAIDASGRVAATHVGSGSKVKLTLTGADGVAREASVALGDKSVGNPVWADGRVLIPMLFNNMLAVVEPAGGEPRQIRVGVAPVAVAAHSGFAYVANWGGDAAKADELSAPTGLEPTADKVRIDDRGVALAGTISVVDLAKGEVVATLTTGRHPTALAIDAAARRLYVANTNDDSITVIDVATRRTLRTLDLKPFAQDVDGIAPSGLALSADGKTLYIACGGINAVAVYNLDRRRIEGLIPTSWYPVSVALDREGKHLAVGTLLGVGSGDRDGKPSNRFVHANRGAAHVVPIPDAAQLASYTAAVVENNRMGFAGRASASANHSAPARAVPMRAGEASLIEHVVYIVKENRTYDQLFGDLPRGNGEPSMVMFGEDVAPNHRKLAMEYVLLDNIYATSGNSANGHQWVTQANELSYTLWPGYQGRSYPFDGTDPLAYAARGFIWDAALARKKTVAVFGEYAPVLDWGDAPRMDLLRRWKAGEPITPTWTTTSPIPPLNGVLARDFPAYSMGVPDVVRADIFKKHLARYEASGKMPNLTIIQLPCDHTMGTRPGSSTPSAMVADNDLALGQVVEALTRSRFWPKMAIFVIEDDSQNGVDHVDGHRTVGLVISPYARRGAVDSTFYAHQSILKTIELQLGLPTLSLFDLIANDMRASFTDTADLTPFTAVTPKQDLFAVNQPLAELEGPARRAALASAEMNFAVPDAVPSALLNRINWHAIKGWGAAYPAPVNAVFSPYFLEEEEADEAQAGDDADGEDEGDVEEAHERLFGDEK